MEQHPGQLPIGLAVVGIQLDGGLKWSLCVGPRPSTLFSQLLERVTLSKVVIGVCLFLFRALRRFLRFGARGRHLLPVFLFLVGEDELPPDPSVVRIERRRLLVLRDGLVDVHVLGLVALVGEVDGFDVVAAAGRGGEGRRDQKADEREGAGVVRAHLGRQLTRSTRAASTAPRHKSEARPAVTPIALSSTDASRTHHSEEEDRPQSPGLNMIGYTTVTMPPSGCGNDRFPKPRTTHCTTA